MKIMADIGMDDWHSQISEGLRANIIDEFTKLQIITEADLQSSVCMFLRSFIHDHSNPRWRVFNQMNQKSGANKKKNIYPDILLTQQEKRMIAIELKQGAGRTGTVSLSDVMDDVEKMGDYGEKYDLETYIIYTCYLSPKSFTEQEESLTEKASEFGTKTPNLVLINIYGTSEHSLWIDRHTNYQNQWKKLFPELEEV